MKAIQEIVELAIWSAAVLEERNPASILLVTPPEYGKTEIIRHFEGWRYTQSLTDLTGWGLVNQVLPAARDQGQRMLLVPDLIQPLSRQQHVAQTMTAALLSFIEEGTGNIATKMLQFRTAQPVCGGIITALTTGELKHRLFAWKENGLLSRFLVISYSYGLGSAQEIAAALRARTEARRNGTFQVALPNPVSVRIPDPNPLNAIEKVLGPYLASVGLTESPGFRVRKHLRRLACAHAARAGRDVLAQQDVDEVCELVSRYGGLEMREAR